MMVRFIIQLAGFGLTYILAIVAAFPFMTIIGNPKPWQRIIEFLMIFPIDNEKIGVFSLPGMIAIAFLNGLLWGFFLIGVFRIACFLKNILLSTSL